jgi:hypothetical protein
MHDEDLDSDILVCVYQCSSVRVSGLCSKKYTDVDTIASLFTNPRAKKSLKHTCMGWSMGPCKHKTMRTPAAVGWVITVAVASCVGCTLAKSKL